MNYIFHIAGMHYRILLDKKIKILDRHRPFLVPEYLYDGKTAGRVAFQSVPDLPPVPEDAVLEQYRYYSPKEDDQTWFIYSHHHPVYAYSDRRKAPEDIRILLTPDGLEKLEDSNVLTLLLETEILLCKNRGLMMHACIIDTPPGGILFTGPSGAGKSTQGKLWEACEGAEILNGDRAGLMRAEGHWYAWGLPFAGSSCIYMNRSTPLQAVIVLDHGQENHIRRLSFREALSCLYPQVHLHHWSRAFMEEASVTLTELLRDIPVYRLTCRPDPDAVELVKRTVFHIKE